MNSPKNLEQCHSFINYQLKPTGWLPRHEEGEKKFTGVTISREAGSGGHSLAEKLAELLQREDSLPGPPWTVFDRNLVERVLQDHNLPGRLAKFMPEDRVWEVSNTMDELFGLHPPSWLLVRQISETILRLAQVGNVILIGRGANIITRKLSHVFHVRLVGSLEKRVKRLQELNQITHKEAAKLAEQTDLARRRYLKQFFREDVDDPLIYHLVINTDLFTIDEVARMILWEMARKPMKMAA
jgi:cytidylate kinase